MSTKKNTKKKAAAPPAKKATKPAPKKPAKAAAPPKRKATNTSNALPLEKDVEKKVCDYAKQMGCYVRKFTSPSQRSVPDRIIITPAGRVIFIEFKRAQQAGYTVDLQDPFTGEITKSPYFPAIPVEPTTSQLAEHEAIRACGIRVFVVCDVQEGKDLLDEQMMGL